MPQRRAPMKRAALQTGKPLARRARLRTRSVKREAAVVEEARVRESVFQRDGGCLLGGVTSVWGPCFGRATFHHLFKAGQGGAYTEGNGVCLCVLHNEAVEDHPRRAREWGLVVTRGIPHATALARRVAFGIHR